MNERIKDLALDAIVENVASEAWVFTDAELEKFAELIVQECVQTLRDNTPMLDKNESLEDWNKGYIRAMVDCEHHIQEHFGVKECLNMQRVI